MSSVTEAAQETGSRIPGLGALSSVFSYCGMWIRPGREAEQALDPFGLMVRLNLLAHFQAGTKVSIKRNGMDIQPCSETPGWIEWGKQASSRKLNGDVQGDLSNIGLGIERAAVWLRPDEDQNVRMKALFEGALPGTTMLRDTYETKPPANTSQMLDLYHAKIEACLEPDSMEGKRIYTDRAVQKNVKVLKALEIWTPAEIDLMFVLLKQLQEHAGKVEEMHYVWAIHSICRGKDALLKDFKPLQELVPQIPQRGSIQDLGLQATSESEEDALIEQASVNEASGDGSEEELY